MLELVPSITAKLPFIHRKESHLIDLTESRPQAVSELASSVNNSNGEVAILVHPFYANTGTYHYPITKDYKANVEKFVDQASCQSVPLVIFEEERKIKDIPRSLPIRGEVFVVRTLPDDPTPATSRMKNVLHHEEWIQDYQRSEMDGLISQTLVGSGVSHALISGRYLFVNKVHNPEQWFTDFSTQASLLPSASLLAERRLFPQGCVGSVIKSLIRNRVDFNISPAISPQTTYNYLADSFRDSNTDLLP